MRGRAAEMQGMCLGGCVSMEGRGGPCQGEALCLGEGAGHAECPVVLSSMSVSLCLGVWCQWERDCLTVWVFLVRSL